MTMRIKDPTCEKYWITDPTSEKAGLIGTGFGDG